MHNDQRPIIVRPFSAHDADACFRMRREAFIRVFCQELGPKEVDAGANAYKAGEFAEMIGAMHSFVAMDGQEPVGFCTVRLLDPATAEILFLYVGLDRVKQGVGTRLLHHAERWVAERYPDVFRVVLDTAVPLHNRRFYEKLGYSESAKSVCKYPNREVPAVRLSKSLIANITVD